MSNPWKQMTPMLKKYGYTEEQINEMTFDELFEILAQNDQKRTRILQEYSKNSQITRRYSNNIRKNGK